MNTEQIKALYRSNFPAFVRFAFRELNPNQPLIDTWHIDVLADHLERVARGEITRLIINLPPRCLKSLAASIALPVWTGLKQVCRSSMRNGCWVHRLSRVGGIAGVLAIDITG